MPVPCVSRSNTDRLPSTFLPRSKSTTSAPPHWPCPTLYSPHSSSGGGAGVRGTDTRHSKVSGGPGGPGGPGGGGGPGGPGGPGGGGGPGGPGGGGGPGGPGGGGGPSGSSGSCSMRRLNTLQKTGQRGGTESESWCSRMSKQSCQMRSHQHHQVATMNRSSRNDWKAMGWCVLRKHTTMRR